MRRHAPVLDGTNRQISLTDLKVGSSFTLYGHVFHICDADERVCCHVLILLLYTFLVHLFPVVCNVFVQARQIYQNEFGEAMAPAQPLPRPSYLNEPTLTQQRYKPTKVFPDAGFEEDPVLGFYKREGDKKGQFLHHDREVLRFEGMWDDTTRPLGDLHRLTVLYHLADDTMEIFEPAYKNDGRGAFHAILSRQRVPWVSAMVKAKNGQLDDTRNRLGIQTVDEAASDSAREHARKQMSHRYRYSKGRDNRYNYTSPITGQPRYIATEHTLELREQNANLFETAREAWAPTYTVPEEERETRSPFVTAADLICGELVKIYGRPLLLAKCDQFTAEWYEENMNVDQTRFFIDTQEKLESVRKQLSLPPHFGISAIGSEEDTRLNAQNFLGGKTPKFDVERFNAYDGKILRFKARLEGDVPKSERDRSFVVNYFVSDGTISVFEDSSKNSGHSRGKFLDRGKHYLIPSEQKDSSCLARARNFGECGYIYGYEHGFGQGYSGGQFGREDRVGPACTGVGKLSGVGIDRQHPQYRAHGRPVTESDLEVGSRLCFAHNPFQELVLTQQDEFTEKYKDNRTLETAEELPFRKLASVLSGCLDSLFTASKQRDLLERSAGAKHHEGFLSKDAMRSLMQRYGACSPVVDEHEIDNILDEEAVNDDSIAALLPPKGTPRFRGYTDPKTGSWICLTAREQREQRADLLSQHKGMVEYRDFIQKLRGEVMKNMSGQSRHLKIMNQLRAALLSSRDHLHRVFRDLGNCVPGIITPKEFRRLLRRHHLDMGISDNELLILLKNYPAASSDEVDGVYSIPEGSISWRGFVRSLIDAENRPQDEVEDFIALVSGYRNELEGGTGRAPEVHKHFRKEPVFTPARKEDGPTRKVFTRESPVDEPTGQQPSRESNAEEHPSRNVCESEGSRHSNSPRSSLSDRMEGASIGTLLSEMADFFQTKKSELVRIFRLYDQSGKGTLPFRSFVNALTSSGYRLGLNEEDSLFHGLENAGALDENGVDYRSFVQSLWDSSISN